MHHFPPPNVAVNCGSCGTAIPFFRPEHPAAEFSLKCQKCERRAIYGAGDARPYHGANTNRFEPPKAKWLFG